MKNFILKILKGLIFILSPLTFLSTLWLLFVKKIGTGKLSYWIFMKLGISPILDNYYQPLINPKKHLTNLDWENRNLPGLDLNIKEQIDLLSSFNYADELLEFPMDKKSNIEYYYNNGLYESGDSEYLYSVVRKFKPKRIVEIGSGNSTLMVRNAIATNKNKDKNYDCIHTCIEPYEMPWLNELGIELIRERVEKIDISFFQNLEANDILFIDSSHIIRPQGDVLYEFLEIIPTLKSGVFIHVHDIFTPKDYPNDWILKEHLLWNEQYLLEAFLTNNNEFKIIGALNHLKNSFKELFYEKFPISAKQPNRQPGAFWIMKK